MVRAGPACRRRGAAIILATVALGAASGLAQEPTTAPAENGPPAHESRPAPPPNFFSLDALDGAIELGGEFEQTRVRHDGPRPFVGTRQRNRRWSFDEVLRLDFDSTVYDPNLLTLTGEVGLGLSQERYWETFNDRSQADSSTGYLADFDLRADFLREKEVSGSAYALRAQDRYARPFLPSLRELRTEYGASLYRAHDVLPMELTFDHRDVDRTGRRLQYDDENLSEDKLRYQATWISSRQHSLKLTYEYADHHERYSGSRFTFDNRRHEIRLDDEVLFGDRSQHRLDTIVRFQDETGDYARDLAEIGPKLSLRHTDHLTTSYQYLFSREEIGQLRADIHRGDWQLVHKLYDNLVTTVNLYGLREDVENDTDGITLGGTADWSYTRNNRWGRLSSNLSLTAEGERAGGGGLRPMIAESGSFRDPLPIILSRRDVLPWTIVVRDSTRGRIFVPGLDYTVAFVRGHAAIFRNFLGAIPNGASVSIDYIYRIDRGGERDTQRVDYSLRQDFDNGWSPYYDFQFRHDDRDMRLAIFRTEVFESQRHRLGIQYRRPQWTAGAEWELLKDTIDPFIAYRAYASWNAVKTARHHVGVRADFSHYFFEMADRDDTFVLELSGDARTSLNTRADAYLTATYRYEDDGTRGRGTIHGVDIEGGLAYQWGLLTLTASVEYDLLTIVDSKEDGLGLFIKVRRDLPGLVTR